MSEHDVEMYIQAYHNLAAVTPQLEAAKKSDHAITVLDCASCRPIIDGAVRKAGFENIQAFIVMDARIHLAVQQLAYLQIARIVGTATQEADAEAFCQRTERPQQDREPEKEQKLCRRLRQIARHLNRLGSALAWITERLPTSDDVAVVEKYADAVWQAWTSEELILDLRHGGDFDD